MYRPVETPLDDMRTAVAFLERGARRFPDDGEMAWDLGAALSFELAPRVDDPAEKERLRALGVEHLETAARLGAGPDWLVFTNATQLRRLGRVEQAIRHLEEMYSMVRDAETRAAIERELAALRSERYAEAFRRANEELEANRLADFPYVPSDLYLLLGRRLPEALRDEREAEVLDEAAEEDAPHL
jgi:tetratricopeptide (TPR) repeat protein